MILDYENMSLFYIVTISYIVKAIYFFKDIKTFIVKKLFSTKVPIHTQFSFYISSPLLS